MASLLIPKCMYSSSSSPTCMAHTGILLSCVHLGSRHPARVPPVWRAPECPGHAHYHFLPIRVSQLREPWDLWTHACFSSTHSARVVPVWSPLVAFASAPAAPPERPGAMGPRTPSPSQLELQPVSQPKPPGTCSLHMECSYTRPFLPDYKRLLFCLIHRNKHWKTK